MSHNSNKKRGISPTFIQDLRREFRIRSAAKNQQANPTSSKSTSRSSPFRRKKQVNALTNRENAPSKYQQQDDNTTSRRHKPNSRGSADKINVREEDIPTEFENDTTDAKPATFTREWHKFSVPLDQLPGNRKKKSKSQEKKKQTTGKASQRKKSSTPSNTPSAEEQGKAQKTQRAVSSKKRGSQRRRKTSDTLKKTERRKSPAHTASSQNKETKTPDVDAKPPRKDKHSIENTSEEIPLVSLDEDEGDKKVIAKRESKLIPAKEEDFKLKPLNDKVSLSPVITAAPCSPSSVTIEEELTAHDDQNDEIERAPKTSSLIEPDKCGNSNFPVVLAAGRIIDYLEEKDLFKEFIEPSDLPIFNSFLSGEAKTMPDLLTILENLMDQIIESKKLSETEATAKDWILVSKDPIEGRNYLLDSFLSKKAKLNVSDQVLTAKKSTSSTTSQSPNPSSTSPSPSRTSNAGEESEPGTTSTNTTTTNTTTESASSTTTTTTEVTTPRTFDPEERKDKNM